ncbi:MAG: hypothetical protein JWO05_1025 [Gemmatimonadetes bacterium]|nr:hypothetical protein [Gemmatimonadota bacterium]
MTGDAFDVEVQYKLVRYREGARVLDFDREPSGSDPVAVVWFPSPKRWRETVPAWAQERRREILSRVRAAVRGDEWRVFYADVDSVCVDDLECDSA